MQTSSISISPCICHIFAQVSVQRVELQRPTVATTHGAVLSQDLPAAVAKVVMAAQAGKAARAVPRAQLHAVPGVSPRGVDTWRRGHDQSTPPAVLESRELANVTNLNIQSQKIQD